MAISSNVLIVDDDPGFVELLEEFLADHFSSVRVFRAVNGETALSILEHYPIDCIMLDLEMPEMEGFEFAEQLRNTERFRAVPIVIISSHINSIRKEKLECFGICSSLDKISYRDTVGEVLHDVLKA